MTTEFVPMTFITFVLNIPLLSNKKFFYLYLRYVLLKKLKFTGLLVINLKSRGIN